MPISSRRAVDLIVGEEVTNRVVYDRKYRHPIWPGERSGVTIGIGYDVGQNSSAQVRRDWAGIIPDNMVDALVLACGVTGERAAGLLSGLKWIDVPWDAAMSVFLDKTLPRYESLVQANLLNWQSLHPDSFGALTSLVYNRGASFSKARSASDELDRYREMRAIKEHMAAGAYYRIPHELRSMKRIWVGRGVDGLLARREREAKLFEDGLLAPLNAPVKKPAPASSPGPVAQPAPQPRAGASAWNTFWQRVGEVFGGGKK